MPMSTERSGALERWDDVLFLLAVARKGSFHAAAREFGVAQTTVSRRVQRLEQRLGAKFFDRHAHGMELTPAGHAFFAKARAMEEAAFAIERELAGFDGQLAGSVRIAAPDGVAACWLTPILMEFQRDNPAIQIDLVAGHGQVDLLSREADIALRLFEPKEPRFVVSKVARVSFSFFAAQHYLDNEGVPRTEADLQNHKILQHLSYDDTSGLEWWHALVRVHANIVLKTNSNGALLRALKLGSGITMLPDFYRISEPDLIRLPIPTHCASGIWLISHEETNRRARVRALLDYLRARFANESDLFWT